MIGPTSISNYNNILLLTLLLLTCSMFPHRSPRRPSTLPSITWWKQLSMDCWTGEEEWQSCRCRPLARQFGFEKKEKRNGRRFLKVYFENLSQVSISCDKVSNPI